MVAQSKSTFQVGSPANDSVHIARAQVGRRLFGGYVFNSMNWGIRLLEQLLLIPLFIYAWGTELYKDWLVVSSIAFFLGWCTFGIDDYFGNNLLRLASTGDQAGFRKELKKALAVATLVSLAVAVLLGSALLAVPIARVLSLSVMDTTTAVLILVIMTPVWIRYPVMVLFSIYRAYGEFSRGECVSGVYMSVQLASLVVALALRQSPIVIAFCLCIACAIYSAAIVADVTRRYPGAALGFAMPERHEWRRIVQQSLLYFTNPLSTAVAQSGVLLVFGFLGIDATSTVAFNTFRVFTGLARQLGVTSFAVSSSIEMARQFAQGNRDACARLYASSGRIVSCLAGILAALTIAISAPFVRLWTHGAVVDDGTLVVCFLAGIFLAAPGRVSQMLLRYTNHAYGVAFSSCAYSIVGLALALLFARPLGGFGVALAFAVTETLGLGLYSSVAVGRIFGFDPLRYTVGSYGWGIAAFLPSYLLARALFDAPNIGFVGLAARLSLWGALILPIVAVCALTPIQRARVISAGTMLWRRATQAWRHG